MGNFEGGGEPDISANNHNRSDAGRICVCSIYNIANCRPDFAFGFDIIATIREKRMTFLK